MKQLSVGHCSSSIGIDIRASPPVGREKEPQGRLNKLNRYAVHSRRWPVPSIPFLKTREERMFEDSSNADGNHRVQKNILTGFKTRIFEYKRIRSSSHSIELLSGRVRKSI
jgi:hypothetical protein